MKRSLVQLVSLIKINNSRRKLTAKVPYSNLNFNVLRILYYEGYIRGFKVTAEANYIYVFLKLNKGNSSILDLAYFCPKNKYSYLTYKKLVALYGLKNFGIVSTNTGLMTLEQCFLYKKGGHLLLIIK
tara:strand:+ start:29 stop:412 length:384 start_codon:yes stop_codon:yes gene_type:complete